jgi:hypothetical protein
VATTTRSTKSALCLVLASFAVSFFAGAQSVKLPASGRFILPVSKGKSLLAQCSRLAPEHVSQFWEPSADDIDELEIALQKYLESRAKAGKPVPPKNVMFHRQYIGFMKRAGSDPQEELFIYGNFYPEEVSSEMVKKKFDESVQPVVACDGGNAFWGIIYKPSTKTFEEIAFNGFA